MYHVLIFQSSDDGDGIDADDGAVDLDNDLGPAIQEEEQPMEVEKEGEEKKDKSKDQENNINNNLTVIDLPNGRWAFASLFPWLFSSSYPGPYFAFPPLDVFSDTFSEECKDCCHLANVKL